MKGSFSTFPSVPFPFPPLPAQRCQLLRKQSSEPAGVPCRGVGSSVSALRGGCCSSGWEIVTLSKQVNTLRMMNITGSQVPHCLKGFTNGERGRPRKNPEVLD